MARLSPLFLKHFLPGDYWGKPFFEHGPERNGCYAARNASAQPAFLMSGSATATRHGDAAVCPASLYDCLRSRTADTRARAPLPGFETRSTTASCRSERAAGARRKVPGYGLSFSTSSMTQRSKSLCREIDIPVNKGAESARHQSAAVHTMVHG